MSDYAELHRRLWQLVQEQEGKLDAGAKALAAALVERLNAEGWQIGPEVQAELAGYFDSIESDLRAGITAATRLGSPREMRDALVAQLAEQAFSERWPDGLSLSNRLWQFEGNTVRGLQQVLHQGARVGQSVNALIYDMQRQIEARGARFQIVHTEFDDWTDVLGQAAKALVHNPKARGQWERTVSLVRTHLDKLAETGTRHAAETAFKKIRAAAEAGRLELVGDAIYWWQYDKQLFLLKRIARTELATAQHRAVIASTEADPDILGYQWRLSSSHPEPDICDYYANIEMGLGKGVWPKDQAPRHKAHPHCMCLLIPRVTPVQQKGAVNYAEFIQGVSPERRAALLPKWAREAMAAGTPLERLIRPDGLGLISQKQSVADLGQDRFQARQMLGRALSERAWGSKDLSRNKKATQRLVDQLQSHAREQEVADFLRRVAADPSRVDSRELHYMQRRYLDGRHFDDPEAMDALYDRILRDPAATVHRKGGLRYQVRSGREGWIAIVEPDGTRVSVYPDLGDDLGDVLWPIGDLIR
jgi:hypothetical protein